MDIKVSVIVPVFNKENDLYKCLDSLLNQTLKEIEVIVINDGSSDKSLEIIRDFKSKARYENKMVILSHSNRHVGYSRNRGLSAAKGEYIGFVDADDYVDKRMFEQYYDYAKKNEIDVLTGDYYEVISDKLCVKKLPSFSDGNLESNLGLINLVDYGICNKIFKRDLVLDSKARFVENRVDYECIPFVASCLRDSSRIGKTDVAYYYYNVRDNNTLSDKSFDIFKILDEVNVIYNCYIKSREFEYFNISTITEHMIKQRNQRNKELRELFIKEGFLRLRKLNFFWRFNGLYRKEPFKKRMVCFNRLLLGNYLTSYYKKN